MFGVFPGTGFRLSAFRVPGLFDRGSSNGRHGAQRPNGVPKKQKFWSYKSKGSRVRKTALLVYQSVRIRKGRAPGRRIPIYEYRGN